MSKIIGSWRHTLAWWNHSPTGLEWGYGGSGPAQLALTLLGAVRDKPFAMTYYQRFKQDVVASLKYDRWDLTRNDIELWCSTKRPAENDSEFGVV